MLKLLGSFLCINFLYFFLELTLPSALSNLQKCSLGESGATRGTSSTTSTYGDACILSEISSREGDIGLELSITLELKTIIDRVPS